jgi:ankyrin repeat protein
MRLRTLMMPAAIFALLSSAAFAQDIHEAARTGDLIKIRALIEQTPGLAGARDQTGRTPLHWACRGVHPEVVAYLVAHGADANARDNANVTPLHSVSSRGHLEAANALVAAGARLDVQMNGQSTPLHLAAAQGHRDLAAFLLEKGAPAGLRDGNEDTPLLAAAWTGKWDVVDRLAGGLPPGETPVLNIPDFDGNTLLLLAARDGRLETVKLLASKGVDLNARNTLGQSAFNLAEEEGFGEIAAWLGQAGADRGPQKFPALSGPYMGQTPPGAEPKLFAKGIVSKRSGFYGTITFSPDGREAFWRPEAPEKKSSMKMEAGLWGPPREFAPAGVEVINVPFFSPDGRRLYFMTGSRNAQGIIEKEAIWFVERGAAGWSEPRPFDSMVNSVPMHWQFSMDKQGHVYLNADGGINCAPYENGRYLAPAPLPAPVNVPHGPEDKFRAGELGPFISPEGDYLIYTKMRAGAPLPAQLLVSFRGKDGSWSEPQNLSEKLRTEGNDSMARVTPDGKYLFFQSIRAGSGVTRGLYWVDARVIEEMRPSKR